MASSSSRPPVLTTCQHPAGERADVGGHGHLLFLLAAAAPARGRACAPSAASGRRARRPAARCREPARRSGRGAAALSLSSYQSALLRQTRIRFSISPSLASRPCSLSRSGPSTTSSTRSASRAACAGDGDALGPFDFAQAGRIDEQHAVVAGPGDFQPLAASCRRGDRFERRRGRPGH